MGYIKKREGRESRFSSFHHHFITLCEVHDDTYF